MTDEIMRISDHVTLEWLDDKKIACLTITDFTRQDLDMWANTIEKLVVEWRIDMPYAFLHDIRTGVLSPYAQARAKKLLTFLQEENKKGRYAVLVGNNIFGQAISMFVNFTLRMNSKHMHKVNVLLRVKAHLTGYVSNFSVRYNIEDSRYDRRVAPHPRLHQRPCDARMVG